MVAEMSEKEAENILRKFNEGRQTLHAFLTKVIQNEDTARLGNLDEEELGKPRIPVRTIKELELFAKKIADEDGWAEYFRELGEIHTTTSLSKLGFLLRLAVTSKKELADVTPVRKKNKGWFKKTSTEPLVA